MTTRPRSLLLTALLALALALTGWPAAAVAHVGPDAAGGVEIVICGKDGPVSIVVDADGRPVEDGGDRTSCKRVCLACAAQGDAGGLHAETPVLLTASGAPATAPAPQAAATPTRPGRPQARAPPEADE